jgi:tetratricopeptide (TPR) repeat protein
MRIAFVLGCWALFSSTVAQTNFPAELGQALNQALVAIENSDYTTAGTLLHRVREANPQDPEIRYDLALGYYLMQEPLAALEVLIPTVLADSAKPHHYQLTGNCLESLELPDSAFAYYKRGLKRFPRSGMMHLEIGKYFSRKLDEQAAIDFWEQGIRVEPTYAPNYYHACKHYARSPNRLWALLYGEMFLNLEPGAERGIEVSRILLATWRDAIRFTSDTTVQVPLTTTQPIAVDDSGEVHLPLPTAFQVNLHTAVAQRLLPRRPRTRPVTVQELAAVRAEFLALWQNQNLNIELDNPLVSLWEALKAANLWEPYHYWLLMRYERTELQAYQRANAALWGRLVKWLEENPLRVPTPPIICSLEWETE